MWIPDDVFHFVPTPDYRKIVALFLRSFRSFSMSSHSITLLYFVFIKSFGYQAKIIPAFFDALHRTMSVLMGDDITNNSHHSPNFSMYSTVTSVGTGGDRAKANLTFQGVASFVT